MTAAGSDFALPSDLMKAKSTSLGAQGSKIGDSVGGQTDDVDVQQAELQDQDLENRAQGIASQYQMNVGSARQLAQLADKVQNLTDQGTMTAEDREAITDAALSVAGLSGDDVNAAIAKAIGSGDKGAIDELMTKAAANLGMPNANGIRDQLLPSLGINF